VAQGHLPGNLLQWLLMQIIALSVSNFGMSRDSITIVEITAIVSATDNVLFLASGARRCTKQSPTVVVNAEYCAVSVEVGLDTALWYVMQFHHNHGDNGDCFCDRHCLLFGQ
jgi:hypothetical protein